VKQKYLSGASPARLKARFFVIHAHAIPSQNVFFVTKTPTSIATTHIRKDAKKAGSKRKNYQK